MYRFATVLVVLCIGVQPTFARPSFRSIRESAEGTTQNDAGWRMQFFTWEEYGLRVTYPESWRDPLIAHETAYEYARIMPSDNELGQRKNYLLELTALVWDTGTQLSLQELQDFAREQSPSRYNEYYVVSSKESTVAGHPAWNMRLSTMTGPREETWVSVGRYTYTLGFRSRNDEYFAADHFFYEDYVDSAVFTPVRESRTNEIAGFSDIDASHPYIQAIEWAKTAGVIGGYPDGSFRPEQTVNRAELLKILYQSVGASVPSVTETSFPDVPRDSWFAPYVSIAKEHGMIQGYEDGTFKPEQTVNAAEALKMAYRVLGIETTPSDSAWYQEYFDHAENHGIFKVQTEPSSGMKRQDIVWILWRLTH